MSDDDHRKPAKPLRKPAAKAAPLKNGAAADAELYQAPQAPTPPHSVDAELIVLGLLLQGGDAALLAETGGLLAEHFFDNARRVAFHAIANLIAAGRIADPFTVWENMTFAEREQVGDIGDLAAAINHATGAASTAARAAAIVRKKSNARRMLALLDQGREDPSRVPALLPQIAALAEPQPDDEPLNALEWEWAHELSDADEVPDDLVQGVITVGAMSVLYGDSNSGKTFAAIHLAAAVASGAKWLGREVEQGLVIYLASESPASVKTRLRAYQQHFGVKVKNLVIVKSPINLFSEFDTAAIVDLVRAIEKLSGRKAVLIIGDTLARLIAGANENSGEDMGVVVAHVDRIRTETGAHFMLIHHSGKNAAMGARGWSGLRAATDTEIEVTEDQLAAAHCMEITKQRDLSTRGDRIGFRLVPVTLGVGKWGSLRTSCVVEGTDAPARSTGKRESAIAGAVVEFLTVRRSGIHRKELLKHFEARYEPRSVNREMKKLREAGVLTESVGIVALTGIRT